MIVSMQNQNHRCRMENYLTHLTQDKINLLHIYSQQSGSNINTLDVKLVDDKFNAVLKNRDQQNMNELLLAKQKLINQTPVLPFSI